MSEQTETIELDDSALFQGAMADEPVEGQPRDEAGRFAPKEADKPAEAVVETKPAEPEVAATAQTEQPKDDAANVPSWRLREVREAREAAEQRATQEATRNATLQAEMQAMRDQLQKLQAPKAEPVDFFADPDQALQQRLTPFEQRFAKLEQDMRLNSSRMTAISVHGAPAVQEMEAAIEKAMQANHPDVRSLAAAMRESNDPAAIAMNWYKRNKLWEVTGGDPDAYKNKVLEEALKDPAYLTKALELARTQAGAPTGRPNISLPPSLNKAAGAGMSNSSADAADMSDRGIFKHAMAR